MSAFHPHKSPILGGLLKLGTPQTPDKGASPPVPPLVEIGAERPSIRWVDTCYPLCYILVVAA